MPHALKPNGLPSGQGLYWMQKGQNQVIWCKMSHHGKNLRMSCKTDKWQDAIPFRDAEKAKLIKHERVIGSKVVRVDELLDDYLSLQYRRNESRTTTRQTQRSLSNVRFGFTFGQLSGSSRRISWNPST